MGIMALGPGGGFLDFDPAQLAESLSGDLYDRLAGASGLPTRLPSVRNEIETAERQLAEARQKLAAGGDQSLVWAIQTLEDRIAGYKEAAAELAEVQPGGPLKVTLSKAPVVPVARPRPDIPGGPTTRIPTSGGSSAADAWKRERRTRSRTRFAPSRPRRAPSG